MPSSYRVKIGPCQQQDIELPLKIVLHHLGVIIAFEMIKVPRF
jgi:hypothetical protein